MRALGIRFSLCWLSIGVMASGAATFASRPAGAQAPARGSAVPERVDKWAVLDVGALPASASIVLVRGERLDAVFPATTHPRFACRSPADSTKFLLYRWTIRYSLPHLPPTTNVRAYLEARHAPVGAPWHTAAITLKARLPRGAPPTPERLDSALTTVSVSVSSDRGTFSELEGNGIQDVAVAAPTRRALYFDHVHLHLAMTAEDALATFLTGAPDSVTLGWCGSRGEDTTVLVPLILRLEKR